MEGVTILDSIFARQEEQNRKRRERRLAASLAGLEELKRQNSINPTPKRTAAIKNLEERYLQELNKSWPKGGK